MVNMVRTPAAFKRLGVGKSQGYERIQQGLLPRPVKVGERASALPDFEVEAVIRAQIAGVSNADLRKLVLRLHEQRKSCVAQMAEA